MLKILKKTKICQIYANDITNINHRNAKIKPKTCQRFAKDKLKICQRYAKDMPKICQWYANDILKLY